MNLVFGGYQVGGLLRGAWGAAYRPDSNTWRELPTATIISRVLASAVWTGERLLVLGGNVERGCCGGEIHPEPGAGEGSVYLP